MGRAFVFKKWVTSFCLSNNISMVKMYHLPWEYSFLSPARPTQERAEERKGGRMFKSCFFPFLFFLILEFLTSRNPWIHPSYDPTLRP